jgi:hypothetical protein
LPQLAAQQAGLSCPAGPSRQQQQRVCVEYVAAFTSPSFAVGYMARNGSRTVLSEVKVLRAPAGAPTDVAECAEHGDTHSCSADEGNGGSGCRQGQVSCLEACCSWLQRRQ